MRARRIAFVTDGLCLARRWATQGFDFLQAIEPVFISALPEEDFLVGRGPKRTPKKSSASH